MVITDHIMPNFKEYKHKGLILAEFFGEGGGWGGWAFN